jgi:hypothetical protein
VAAPCAPILMRPIKVVHFMTIFDRHSSCFLWILAVLLTLATAIYQRMTGPTYPLKKDVVFVDQTIEVKLERSHAGPGDQTVSIAVEDASVQGDLLWRRYPTMEAFAIVPMQRQGHSLIGQLPHQPPAGKLEYRVRLRTDRAMIVVPSHDTVVTRFRGSVPAFILIPHILIMFLAMAYSNRAGLEALYRRPSLCHYTLLALFMLFLGGLIMGPLVQKYAFGAFWTGFPVGHDLTDSKTLVAFIAWFAAYLKVRKNPTSRSWIMGAALITLIVYLIPHSLLGSELKYE